jgi:hypothetical protein
LNKAGEIFPTNFIGEEDSLYFSNYELTQQKKYKEAKPTTMSDVNPDSDDSDDTELTDDFEL